MFGEDLVIVDLETTGMTPEADRITEIAVLRIADGTLVHEWSRLVNPGRSIPSAIRWLTGISDEMVAGAPRFAEIATELARKLDGAIFVAHNARFDYGFLKAEFERAGIPYTAKTLCTVRLSRALYPQYRQHGLDALIARHDIEVQGRHRALGDARAVWEFLNCVRSEIPAEAMSDAVSRLLKRPSLPSQLPADALDAIPHGPGVYIFYGANRQPLYVGKSVDLRERVGTHFSSDHRSERDLRLSQEIVSIEFEATAGEFGALLRESTLVKQIYPAHNVRLRKREKFALIAIDRESGRARFLEALEDGPDSVEGKYGVFNSRLAARKALEALADETRLCRKRLGLESGSGPCFAFQLRRCRGACVEEETNDAHLARVEQALERYLIPAWPHRGAIAIAEGDGARQAWHVFDRWCYLGTTASIEEASMAAAQVERRFDADAFRILTAHLRRQPEAEVIGL